MIIRVMESVSILVAALLAYTHSALAQDHVKVTAANYVRAESDILRRER